MAATEATTLGHRLLQAWHRVGGALRAVLGGLLASHAAVPVHTAQAATLPEERSEALLHHYDGGGVKASGPAFLVRKSLADKVSLSAQYYVDAVSNASVDVVTTASPFRETRTAASVGADWLVRDAVLSLSLDRSREPDYEADTWSANVTQEVFGGMSTVSLGYSRAQDNVGTKTQGFFDYARHWQYRAGLTQILTPRWLASLNVEAVSDEGYLASPYRAARVFGAAVPERLPRTRSSRAVKLRSVSDLGEGASRTALRVEYRYFWDNWDITGHTFELGAARRFGPDWLVDASLRHYSQSAALFFADNAQRETRYVSRNRQLGTFSSQGLNLQATWTAPPQFSAWGASHGLRATLGVEFKRFDFKDYTDLRTGAAYSHNAHVLQATVSATF